MCPLSNMYPCRLKVDDVTYQSVEHAYQSMRAIYFGDIVGAQDMRSADSGYDAKTITSTRSYVNTPWCNRVEVMRRLLRCKLSRCVHTSRGYRLDPVDGVIERRAASPSSIFMDVMIVPQNLSIINVSASPRLSSDPGVIVIATIVYFLVTCEIVSHGH